MSSCWTCVRSYGDCAPSAAGRINEVVVPCKKILRKKDKKKPMAGKLPAMGFTFPDEGNVVSYFAAMGFTEPFSSVSRKSGSVT